MSFCYPGAKDLALDEVNLTIARGECVALVGPSGGGKTTITDLLTALLRPTAGRILIDERDLNSGDTLAWRKEIGLVTQEPFLLNTSVGFNVAMTERVYDHAQTEKALREADAWDFVDALPEGIDTTVADRGARLSGGQRQRLMLARALFRNPSILILDEATSALDGESEQRVQAVIEAMKGRTTLIMVAHRLKTVGIADQIIVVDGGRVSESGSWDELLKLRGTFYGMAKLQGLV